MSVRKKLLESDGCSFDTIITVNFGDRIQNFGMQCRFDKKGNLFFTVKSPEMIAGITGEIAAGNGRLTFDDKVLAFPLLADGEISPVSAPWLLMKSLRSGYLSSSSTNKTIKHVHIEDSYEAEPLTVDVCLNASDLPISGEIFWKGTRILTIAVEKFAYL